MLGVRAGDTGQRGNLDECPEPGDLVNLCFELRQLELIDRTGWGHFHHCGASVAAHTSRGAQIAFFLASLEKHPDPHYVAAIFVFHDVTETRSGDGDAVALKYVTIDHDAILKDQTANLGSIGTAVYNMWHEVNKCETPAGIIAKDADRLECLLETVEYEKRHGRSSGSETFIKYALNSVKTSSAKQLATAILKGDPDDWWINLQRPIVQEQKKPEVLTPEAYDWI